MNETTNGANCSPEQGAIDTTWKPKILAFCCNWCTYAGADLAGLNRMEYPADIRLLRVPCSGRVNPQYCLLYTSKDRLPHYLPRNKLGNATSLVFSVINSAIIGRLINLDLRDRKTRICHSIIEVTS